MRVLERDLKGETLKRQQSCCNNQRTCTKVVDVSGQENGSGEKETNANCL
jgi:hypothetical protein